MELSMTPEKGSSSLAHSSELAKKKRCLQSIGQGIALGFAAGITLWLSRKGVRLVRGKKGKKAWRKFQTWIPGSVHIRHKPFRVNEHLAERYADRRMWLYYENRAKYGDPQALVALEALNRNVVKMIKNKDEERIGKRRELRRGGARQMFNPLIMCLIFAGIFGFGASMRCT